MHFRRLYSTCVNNRNIDTTTLVVTLVNIGVFIVLFIYFDVTPIERKHLLSLFNFVGNSFLNANVLDSHLIRDHSIAFNASDLDIDGTSPDGIAEILYQLRASHPTDDAFSTFSEAMRKRSIDLDARARRRTTKISSMATPPRQPLYS